MFDNIYALKSIIQILKDRTLFSFSQQNVNVSDIWKPLFQWKRMIKINMRDILLVYKCHKLESFVRVYTLQFVTRTIFFSMTLFNFDIN